MSETYLTTAYEEKDAVKALGAKWEPDQRRWYVPAGRDLAAFAAWLPEEVKQTALIASTAAVPQPCSVSVLACVERHPPRQ